MYALPLRMWGPSHRESWHIVHVRDPPVGVPLEIRPASAHHSLSLLHALLTLGWHGGGAHKALTRRARPTWALPTTPCPRSSGGWERAGESTGIIPDRSTIGIASLARLLRVCRALPLGRCWRAPLLSCFARSRAPLARHFGWDARAASASRAQLGCRSGVGATWRRSASLAGSCSAGAGGPTHRVGPPGC